DPEAGVVVALSRVVRGSRSGRAAEQGRVPARDLADRGPGTVRRPAAQKGRNYMWLIAVFDLQLDILSEFQSCLHRMKGPQRSE
ncbi:hypothetical protein ABT382_30790, partial [Streptomyces pharetrae]|uniref:hypothetical protein n=1 Tax=Streptomyces pharetrae TaxID=291370 RepID=UPI003347DBC5